MASEYYLQEEIQKLGERGAELKALSENDINDMEIFVSELDYIQSRAQTLRDAASEINAILEKV